MQSHSPNINDSFFKGIYKEVWKKMMPPGMTVAECDFIEEISGLEKFHVLDLMCGHGRHAIELAVRGHTVTAIDNNQDYISEIHSIAVEKMLELHTLAAGVIEADFKGMYDAAICMGNSFAFFNKEDARYLLQKIQNHLKPGGVFIMNSWMVAEVALKHFRERDWHMVEEYKYMLHYRYRLRPSRIESEHTIIDPAGRVEVINGVDYVFTISEMEQMFEEAGLHLEGAYGTPKKRPFKLGDNNIYLVGRKPL